MKRKKWVMALSLIIVVILLATACGNSDENKNNMENVDNMNNMDHSKMEMNE